MLQPLVASARLAIAVALLVVAVVQVDPSSGVAAAASAATPAATSTSVISSSAHSVPLTWLLPCADMQYRVSAALSKRPEAAKCYPSGTCKRVLVDE